MPARGSPKPASGSPRPHDREHPYPPPKEAPMTAAAFPFVKVDIDTSGLQPTAERSPGVIAIVGKALPSANAGAADPNTPYVIATLDDAKALFAKVDGDGNLQ